MYTLLKKSEIKKFTRAEITPLFTALVFTEIFYHFGSFILEVAAFVATWYTLSFIFNHLFSSLPGSGKKKNGT